MSGVELLISGALVALINGVFSYRASIRCYGKRARELTNFAWFSVFMAIMIGIRAVIMALDAIK